MATSTGDVISTNPTASYEAGDFIITGHASSPAGVKSVSLNGLGSRGTTTLGTTTVDANGNFTFDVPITGTSYSSIYATETDNAGASKEVNTEFSFDGNWSGEPFVASEDQLTQFGLLNRSLYFRADGSVEEEDLYTPSGPLAVHRINATDGTSATTVSASDFTVQVAPYDVIQNSGKPGNTFIFDPGDGIGVIRQFHGNGTDHDTLSLKGADFGNSIAEVLANTHQYKGVGTYIVDPVTRDAVRLANVSKAELAVNTGDITFHA